MKNLEKKGKIYPWKNAMDIFFIICNNKNKERRKNMSKEKVKILFLVYQLELLQKKLTNLYIL